MKLKNIDLMIVKLVQKIQKKKNKIQKAYNSTSIIRNWKTSLIIKKNSNLTTKTNKNLNILSRNKIEKLKIYLEKKRKSSNYLYLINQITNKQTYR